MKPILTLVFAGLFALPLSAQEAAEPVPTMPGPSIFIDGTDVDLKQFLWKNRPLVVFADSANDPRFVQQMELLRARSDALAEGTRLYGFFPLAEELVIVPQDDGHGVVLDTAAHRDGLPAVYNRYVAVKAGTPEQDHLRWSRFRELDPDTMFLTVSDAVFPFLREYGRQVGGEDSTYSAHMKDARFTIPNAGLLASEQGPL